MLDAGQARDRSSLSIWQALLFHHPLSSTVAVRRWEALMVTVLIAALLASAPVAPQTATPIHAPQAHPAMWVVRDHDTTVYLFGTFHALDGRSVWFNNAVRDAFSNSDELILETVIPDRSRTFGPAPNVRPMQGFSVAPGASFLATTRMALSAGRDQGMHVSKGADMVLRRAAEAEGKAVEGFETVNFQLSMYNRMASVRPQAAPVGNPAARSQFAAIMTLMQSAWNRGDQRVFAALLEDMRRTAPDNYRAMFPERNAHWANWIVNRMEQPGTVFVAVGAGHFAGPDSVQSKLTLKGVVATRAN